MKKNDQFTQVMTTLEKYDKQIADTLKEREAAIKKGQPSGRLDYLLRSITDNIRLEMKTMEKITFSYENEYDKYPDISHKDLMKRVDKYNILKKKLELSITAVKSLIDGPNSSVDTQQTRTGDIESQPLVKRGADGEYDDTRGVENQQLLQKQKDMFNKQEDHLDEIGGVVKAIKYENENFTQEVNMQIGMLDKLDSDIEKTNT